jgi:hypothetical protein
MKIIAKNLIIRKILKKEKANILQKKIVSTKEE